jgi:hypothetical protein
MEKNRKKLFGLFTTLLLTCTFAATLPLSRATPGTIISGRWVGIASTLVASNHRTAGANLLADVYNEGTYITGDILGSFEQTFSLVMHYESPEVVANLNPNPALNPEAAFNWNNMDRTFTGTVLGVSGEFTMRLQAKGYGNTLKGPAYWDLQGTWVIISGTGGLANLHGQGTWWHSRTGFTGLEYEGKVHFDP